MTLDSTPKLRLLVGIFGPSRRRDRANRRVAMVLLGLHSVADCYAVRPMPKMLRIWPLVVVLLALLALGAPTHAQAQGQPSVVAQPIAVQAQGPLPVSAADASWGSASAPVTLVHFSDLECPFCRKMTGTLAELRKKYGPSQLRIVFKHMPLPFHKNARAAAEASVAVHQLRGDTAFWAFTDATYEHIRDRGPLGSLPVVNLSESLVNRTIAAGGAAAKVDADIDLAGVVGVRGTPASFVNGVFLSGARPVDQFTVVIDEQLAEAAKLRAAGIPATAISLQLTKTNFVAPAARPSRAATAADTTTVWKVPVGKSPQLGSIAAPVTLVVFSDFQCPFCKRLVPTLETLRADYGKNLRVVFKNQPLPFHNRAEPAAQLAMHAYRTRGSAGFWRAHDLLFERQRTLEDSDLEQIAGELGMNRASTLAAVRAHRYRNELDDDADLASEVDANGAPASFINGRRLSGTQPLEAFKRIIDEELVHATKLRAQGVLATRLYDHMIKDGKQGEPPEFKQLPPATSANPSKGPARAPVTITIFSDFQCPFCRRVLPTLEQIEQEFPTQVRFVFRHKPLSFHKDAMMAHRAAAEAFAQGGNPAFWKMHDWLFENQQGLDKASILNAAAGFGLDSARMDQAIGSSAHAATIAADIKVSDDANISGTPGFVINGEFISGAQPFRRFRRAIRSALRPKPARRKP